MNRASCLSLAAVVALQAVAPLFGAAEKTEHGFTDRTCKDTDGKEYKYVLFVPHDYKGEKAYPVILFLHGAGEWQGGTKAPVDVGIGQAIKKLDEKEFGFFVLFPRFTVSPDFKKRNNWHAGSPDSERALRMLDHVQKDFKIDSKRVYLTGLSMGGYGTWSLAAKYPDKWAAIVPICGGGDPKDAAKIKHIPCWCFHGDEDKAVRVEESREMIDALKAAGGKPRYTEYAGVAHNSWDRAYETKELYVWLLKQTLK